MQTGFLCTLTSQLRYAGHGLAFVLTLAYFILKHVGHIFLMDVQIVVNLALYKVSNILVYGFTARLHQRRTKLNLGLRLKNRLLNVDGNSCNNTVSYICKLVVFIEKLLDRAGYMLLKSTLMRTALRSMLTVHKAMILFSILVCMGESYLNILAFNMNDGVKRVYGHIVDEQILQPIAALDAAPVIHNGKPRVEIGIVS